MSNKLHKINLFTRSLVFSILMMIATIIQSFICILMSPFPLRYRYASVARYTDFNIWLLKVICGVHYQVSGKENVPKDRAGIVLSKHQSTWETFFFPGQFHELAIILKRELLWLPFFGWGLATISPIAINRGKKASAMNQIINKGKQCLQEGRWILIFPEGTRIPVGEVGKYRLGGARLAIETDAPIIPIAHNAGLFWPRRQFIKKPGTVQIVIGPVINPTGKSAEALTEEVKQWIEGTIASLPTRTT